jgi:hypothetical protein
VPAAKPAKAKNDPGRFIEILGRVEMEANLNIRSSKD